MAARSASEVEAVSVSHWSVGAVGDDKLFVYSDHEPEGDEEEFEGEVEDVETCVGEIPWDHFSGWDGVHEGDGSTVDGTDGENRGGEEDDDHLPVERPSTEVVDCLGLERWMRFSDGGNPHNRNRKNGRYRKDDIAEKLDLLGGLLGESIVEVGLNHNTDNQQKDCYTAEQCPETNG